MPREPMVPVVYDNVTRRELTAAEQRIVDMLRAEMAERIVRMREAGSTAAVRAAAVNNQSVISDAEHTDIVRIVQAITGDLAQLGRTTDDRIQDLKSQVDTLRTAVTSPPR